MVSFCESPIFSPLQNIADSKATFLAGSFSRLLTLSGISSEVIAAIGGQSGSVSDGPWLLYGRRADFSFYRSTPFRA